MDWGLTPYTVCTNIWSSVKCGTSSPLDNLVTCGAIEISQNHNRDNCREYLQFVYFNYLPAISSQQQTPLSVMDLLEGSSQISVGLNM